MAKLDLITSSTRPAAPAAGKAYFETDTNKVIIWDGAAWTEIVSDTVPAFSNAYSVEFDGGNDYINAGNDSSLNISGDITLSAWVKQRVQNNYGAIFSKRQVGGSMNYQLIMKNGTGAIGLGHSGGSWFYDSTSLPTGSWYHVAATVSSGTIQLYVNGEEKDSTTGATITGTTQDLIIGATLGYNYFDGLMDELAIFSSALSSTQIATMYNSGVPASLSSLSPVSWWRMGDNDNGTGTTITDQGSGSNNGTLTNGPTFSSSVPS